jgi:hypothetical protein
MDVDDDTTGSPAATTTTGTTAQAGALTGTKPPPSVRSKASKSLAQLQGKDLSALEHNPYARQQKLNKKARERNQRKFGKNMALVPTKYETRFKISIWTHSEDESEDRRKVAVRSAAKYLEGFQKFDKKARLMPWEKDNLVDHGPPYILKPGDLLDLTDSAMTRKFLDGAYFYTKGRKSTQAKVLVAHDMDRDDLLEKMRGIVGKNNDIPGSIWFMEVQCEQQMTVGILWNSMPAHPIHAMEDELSRRAQCTIVIQDRGIFPGKGVVVPDHKKPYQKAFHVYCDKKDFFRVRKTLRWTYNSGETNYPFHIKLQYSPTRDDMDGPEATEQFDILLHRQYK